MHGRRGFLAALAGLAVCPQAPAAARIPPALLAELRERYLEEHRCFVRVLGAPLPNAADFYRPARRPTETR